MSESLLLKRPEENATADKDQQKLMFCWEVREINEIGSKKRGTATIER